MIERFQGDRGKQLLRDVLAGNRMLVDAPGCLDELIERAELVEFEVDSVLIEQAADTNELYLILAGSCDIVINGRKVGVRGAANHVGEMAAIQPTQPRSATVIAAERIVALRVAEDVFSDLAGRFPAIYRSIAQELSRRLLDRNRTVGAFREQIRVFIVCSVEALPIARIIANAFEHDPFAVEIWNEGCFKVSNYTLQDLEAAVDNSDFAIAIAHADDVTRSRKTQWPAPRDNVIFELGLFMGRLGRARAILMEPRDKDIKLPSDLAGITAISYRFEKGGENQRLMGPACNKLREHINALGANNG
jgi:predicted nucleotide-binding protein